MSLELQIGKVGVEAPVDAIIRELRELHGKLRRLEGPSQEDIEAAKTVVKGARKTGARLRRRVASRSWDFRGQGLAFLPRCHDRAAGRFMTRDSTEALGMTRAEFVDAG